MNRATYSIDTMHGDEICAGLSNVGEAQELAQRHANSRNEPVYIYGDDIDDAYEVEPESESE